MRRLSFRSSPGAGLPAAVVALALLHGCAGAPGTVARVVDGRTLEGRYVSPQAYEQFLRGAIAEESGALDEALAAYESVARDDPADPETFARIARIRCRKRPDDPRARAAIDTALALDPDYGPAFAARALCSFAAAGDVQRAARLEPRNVELQIAAATTDGALSAGAEKLVAITAAFRTSTAAWEALASWADTHGDPALAVRASMELVRLSPSKAAFAARIAEALAGEGELALARRLAVAVVAARADTARGGAPAPSGLMTRLAVDEALLRGDEASATFRATLGRLPLDEVAARALRHGRLELAEELASRSLAADPASSGARVVARTVALLRGRAAPSMPAPGEGAVSGFACAMHLRVLADRLDVGAARDAAAALPCAPAAPGDAVLTGILVELAARSVLGDATLPPDARLELMVRRGEVPAGPPPAALDLRHRLLWLAVSSPDTEETRTLAARALAHPTRDPLVAAALLRIALARHETVSNTALDAAARLDPADPILLATLIAGREHDGATAALRVRLRSVAATPKERSLAEE